MRSNYGYNLPLELDFTATAGLVAGCVVILAAIPMTQRRITSAI